MGDMHIDDLGLAVEDGICNDPAKLCNYLLVRILKKHGRPYRDQGIMYINGNSLGKTNNPDKNFANTLLRLIDSPLPVKITNIQIMWFFNRLFDMSTPLDNNVIQVSDDLVFNMNKGKFEKKEEYER